MTESQPIQYELKAEIEQLDLNDVRGGDDVELGMVIDMQRCTGCSACNIACKNENNVEEGHAWASRIVTTEGQFPNVSYEYRPTLCNQCTDAPCANGCPTGSLYKGAGGITMQDPEKCIGCKYCMVNCPYDAISFNEGDAHQRWDDDAPAYDELTSSPAETADEVGQRPPYFNPDRGVAEHEAPIRDKGVVEKCNFCYHRVSEGEVPYCVEACPCDARVIGDLNDPDSKINEILGKYKPERLKESEGTGPKVFYVRDFNPARYERSKGEVGDLATGD